MLLRLVAFAVQRPWAVVVVTVVAALIGYGQMLGVPIEAFPDVTNLQVQVITLAPGRAAEEVERQVTIPIERELAGTPDMVDLRSISVFGLSQITCTFDDGADDFRARTRVGERLREVDLPGLWRSARDAGFATPNIGLLTDLINCPGGDFCALANARSIPVAAAITERFADLDAVYDIGDIDLHISGCINSCGHHHSGHIGILGVDKDGSEWYQVTLGGSDGSTLSGPATAGKVIGPSFAADEVPDVIEALIDTYRRERLAGERFIETYRRIGVDAFRAAADAQRHATALAAA